MFRSNSTMLLYCTALVLFVACDKIEPNGAITTLSDEKISIRTTCENCNDCCCSISLDEDTAASIFLCGTADGGSPCSEDGDCAYPDPSGGGQTIQLTSSLNPRQTFCMDYSSALAIVNTSSSDGADIAITCQYESSVPQTVKIHLDPDVTVFYETDGSCEVSACN